MLLGILAVSLAASQPQAATACTPSFARAIVCYEPSAAAQAWRTYGRDDGAITEFRMHLLSAGCGTFDKLNADVRSSMYQFQWGKVALPTGLVRVTRLGFTYPHGDPGNVWIASDYLKSCPKGSPP